MIGLLAAATGSLAAFCLLCGWRYAHTQRYREATGAFASACLMALLTAGLLLLAGVWTAALAALFTALISAFASSDARKAEKDS